MRLSALVTAAIIIVLLVTAGCGTTVPLSVSGKTYLNMQEEADSRTIRFNPDGTFLYTITTVDSDTTNTGTYVVGDKQVTLTFGPGRITEYAGKTIVLHQDGKLLVDPDTSRWMIYSQ